jgi:hypothetical protein
MFAVAIPWGHGVWGMRRSGEAAPWLGSLGLIVLAVAALFVTHGGEVGADAGMSVICDAGGGGCFHPDAEIAAIVAGALAPIAFAVGLVGLLCALALHVVLGVVLDKTAAGRGPEVSNQGASRPAESIEQFTPPLSR